MNIFFPHKLEHFVNHEKLFFSLLVNQNFNNFLKNFYEANLIFQHISNLNICSCIEKQNNEITNYRILHQLRSKLLLHLKGNLSILLGNFIDIFFFKNISLRMSFLF